MIVRFFTKILEQTYQGKFLPLLITILLYLGVVPLLTPFLGFKFLLDILFSMILISAVLAAGNKRHHTIIALSIAIPTLFMLWMDKFVITDRLLVGSYFLGAIFFGYIIVRMLIFIFTETRVTRNVIYAAIIVYLLMGLFWADFYLILNHFQPGSFDITGIQTDNSNLVLIYFSYVTLTTLGYGDISPLTDIGYSLAILEAIIGQLYLTVMIARLVGLHIAHSGAGKGDR